MQLLIGSRRQQRAAIAEIDGLQGEGPTGDDEPGRIFGRKTVVLAPVGEDGMAKARHEALEQAVGLARAFRQSPPRPDALLGRCERDAIDLGDATGHRLDEARGDLGAARQFGRGGGLLLRGLADGRHHRIDLAHQPEGLADEDRRALGVLVKPVDLAADGIDGLADLERERLHLLRDDAEALAGLAGPRCLDGGIQRQQVGLARDLGDGVDDRADLAGRGRQPVDHLRGLGSAMGGVVEHVARAGHRGADILRRLRDLQRRRRQGRGGRARGEGGLAQFRHAVMDLARTRLGAPRALLRAVEPVIEPAHGGDHVGLELVDGFADGNFGGCRRLGRGRFGRDRRHSRRSGAGAAQQAPD